MVLSTELIKGIKYPGHRRQVEKLTFLPWAQEFFFSRVRRDSSAERRDTSGKKFTFSYVFLNYLRVLVGNLWVGLKENSM